jgi:hypothetical protein
MNWDIQSVERKTAQEVSQSHPRPAKIELQRAQKVDKFDSEMVLLHKQRKINQILRLENKDHCQGHADKGAAVCAPPEGDENEAVDGRILKEVDAVGEQGNRANGAGDSELDTEIVKIEKPDEADGTAQWLALKDWEEVTKTRRLAMLKRVVFPAIGKLPVRQITPGRSQANGENWADGGGGSETRDVRDFRACRFNASRG